jgi:Tol biopolymer transport system component
VSRSGRFLTFADKGNLALRDLGAGTSRVITSDANQTSGVDSAAVSVDDKRVAFLWNTGSAIELRIVDVAGGPARTVPNEARGLRQVVSWPDADQLFVATAPGPQTGDFGFLNITTGRYRSVLRTRNPFSKLSLSPDERFIVVAEWRTDNPGLSELRIVDVTTGAARPLVSDSASNNYPAWTADGAGVVFLREHGAVDLGLWRQAVAGGRAAGAPTKLLSLPRPMHVFGVDARGAVFLVDPGGGQTAYVAHVDWDAGASQDVKPLLAAPFTSSRRAVFSPDGSKLEFEAKWPTNSPYPGWVTPTVISLSDGVQRSYPTSLTIRDAPVWSADGRSLVFISEPAGGAGEGAGEPWEFWRLDLAKGTYLRETVMTTTGVLRAVGMAGQSVVYQRNQYGDNSQVIEAAVEEFDLTTHKTRVIYRTPGAQILGAALSGDGRHIALTAPGSSDQDFIVSILTPPETKPKPLITLGRTARPQFSWLRGDQSVLASGILNGQDGLWRIPVDGSKPVLMRFEQRGFTEARTSPDGQHLTYTVRDPIPGRLLIYEPGR